MSEWKPIETVPEFVPVLVWVPGINRGHASAEVVIIYRDEDGSVSYWTNGGANAGSDMYFKSEPTHWMPLPEPPKP